ncbi:transposase family protein [Nocardia fusca]|uniref:transposase family protein n=1 Tax=Nocardia fusca TaxID=941183 RepID=UPI0037C59932
MACHAGHPRNRPRPPQPNYAPSHLPPRQPTTQIPRLPHHELHPHKTPSKSCSTPSQRVHSRYRRRLADTAITGREVLIVLRLRRLFCDNTNCGRKTFAQQLPGLAARYGRRTLLLQRVLSAVALALGGRSSSCRHLSPSARG